MQLHQKASRKGEVEKERIAMVKDVLERVRAEDPVRGGWNVPEIEKGVIWCDASNITIEVILEVGDVEMEDVG